MTHAKLIFGYSLVFHHSTATDLSTSFLKLNLILLLSPEQHAGRQTQHVT